MKEEASAPNKGCRTNEWGVDLAYEDALGEWHDTSEASLKAILHAMDSTRAGADNVFVLRSGESRPISQPAELFLEDGTRRKLDGELPSDLPTGYHRLVYADQAEARVIVSPGQCWLPDDLKTWGWSVQLYGARSRKSWGIGDLRDLGELASWAATEGGAQMMLLNPLAAASPLAQQQASPYYPSSRTFYNMLALHIANVPAPAQVQQKISELEGEALRLNESRLIDRDRVYALKNQALRLIWSAFEGDAGFEKFCRDRGSALETFATFCALTEKHNSGWHTWPEEYRHPSNPAVREFAQSHAGEIRFHQWVQWHLDRQLAETSNKLALMQDLPIGVDPDGADAWAWQDVFAPGIGVGAPPDEFNTQGQNWGLPPFDPHRLRSAGYEPLIQTFRAAFRHCGGLRIDHVMGLFRLFWVPNGMSAAEGAYVRYAADELLAILALESHRAKAYVVGEDLGTVEPHARQRLSESNVLSYRVVWFEKDKPAEYPANALAAVTTHDLPTVAGLWSGSDLKRQHELGLHPNDASTSEIIDRVQTWIGTNDKADVGEVIARVYRLLGSAPCRLLVATLDDALQVEERPNFPATNSDQNPNWSMALPEPIESIMQKPLAREIAAALRTRSAADRASSVSS